MKLFMDTGLTSYINLISILRRYLSFNQQSNFDIFHSLLYDRDSFYEGS